MNYTFTIDEHERQAIAEALAIFARKLATTTPLLDAKSDQRAAAPLRDATQSPSTKPPAAAQAPAPIELRDRWAKDRKGKELPSPDGCWPADVNLWKTQQTEKFLRVTWQTETAGHADANCFDRELWPWLTKQTGQKTRIYLKKNGNYLNVVGVRA